MVTRAQRAIQCVAKLGRRSWRTMLTRSRSVLPIRATPLIGRERELDLLQALVQSGEVQLVTLTGPGGVGKTRLAIELLHQTTVHFQQRAFFVDLADVADQQHVVDAIAAAGC